MLIFCIEVNSHKVMNRVTKFLDCKSDRMMIHEDLLSLRLENSTQGTRELIEQGLTLMRYSVNGVDSLDATGCHIVYSMMRLVRRGMMLIPLWAIERNNLGCNESYQRV